MYGSSPDRKYNGIFMDETIDVTGLRLFNPVFDRCTVERRKSDDDNPTVIFGAIYNNCSFTGGGWPDGWSSGSGPVPST